eukprot:scaffold1744_cov340-Prasinococcus_capsulatus_cf.AAC.27
MMCARLRGGRQMRGRAVILLLASTRPGAASGVRTCGGAAMLVAYTEQLAKLRIVLASQSPRRSELLHMLQLPFEVVVSNFDEDLDKSSFPSAAAYAEETATHKAIDVTTRCMAQEGQSLPDLVIGADTVVELAGKVLEKPKDEEDAKRMLSQLQGKRHEVRLAWTKPFTFRRPSDIAGLGLSSTGAHRGGGGAAASCGPNRGQGSAGAELLRKHQGDLRAAGAQDDRGLCRHARAHGQSGRLRHPGWREESSRRVSVRCYALACSA